MEANHNLYSSKSQTRWVAYDIAKIYIWKQITTVAFIIANVFLLLMILQRYTFGSKSQLASVVGLCIIVAYDIAKIYIWKQITTKPLVTCERLLLLMILQRYTFGSKSQHSWRSEFKRLRCLWYCKDIHLEANHNLSLRHLVRGRVAYDIAKIYIWKQITTHAKSIIFFC